MSNDDKTPSAEWTMGRDVIRDALETFSNKVDRLDTRFDRIDSRFDALGHQVRDVGERVARVEGSNLGGRVDEMEKASARHSNRLTRIETFFLPVTALGGALVAGLGTWVWSLIPPHG